MTRCFLALNLPVTAKIEFQKIQATLKDRNPNLSITWVEPDITHINLHFLGDLDQKVINNITQKLAALKANFGPISAHFKAVSTFPNLKNPKILHLSLSYSPNLKTLQQSLANIIKQEKITLDQRPYTPHITLGRLKQIFSAINIPTLPLTKEFIISSFELMSSTLTPTGPVYHIIKKYEL